MKLQKQPKLYKYIPYLLLCLIGCTSCALHPPYAKEKEPEHKKEEALIKTVMFEFADIIADEYDARLDHYEFIINEKIDNFGGMFVSYYHLSKDEIRKLLVDANELLIKTVNENKEIKPYLANDPFTRKNLYLGFAFYNAQQRRRAYPDISHAAIGNEQIIYCYKNEHKDPSGELVESYEEAIAILKQQEALTK